MIIIDTSTWVDHFRGIDTLLDSPPVQSVRRLLHPFVYGELLLGGLLTKDYNLLKQAQRLDIAYQP